MTNLTPFAAPVGRILLASIFVLSGLQKLGDPAGTAAYIASGGLPGILVWPTIALEILGGLFLAAGFLTRTSALALAAFTVLAAVLYHLIPAGSAEGMMAQLQVIMFLKNLSIAGGLIFVAAMGAGAFSVDDRTARPVAA